MNGKKYCSCGSEIHGNTDKCYDCLIQELDVDALKEALKVLMMPAERLDATLATLGGKGLPACPRCNAPVMSRGELCAFCKNDEAIKWHTAQSS